MKKTISILIALCFSTIAMAQKATDNFSGKWRTAEGIIIEISKSGTSFNGKPTDRNIFILKDLTFTKSKWIGVLSNPQKSTTVDCEAYLEVDKIKFVVNKGIIKKEIFWAKEN